MARFFNLGVLSIVFCGVVACAGGDEASQASNSQKDGGSKEEQDDESAENPAQNPATEVNTEPGELPHPVTPTEASSFSPPLPPGWPSYYFINVKKQFSGIQDMGITPDTYFNWRHAPPNDEICQQAKAGELLVGVVYQQWWVTMDELGLSYSGENDEKLIQSLTDASFVHAYLEKFKVLLQELNNCGGRAVITLEHDPISFIMREIWRNRENDPTAVFAAISASGHSDALASGAPDNFAGFFQVMDYLRKTYAPAVQLTPTVKTDWGTSVRLNLVEEPADGWFQHDGPKNDAQFFIDMGVDWDIFAMTFHEGTPQEEEAFLSKARYMAAIAYHMNLRIFNWKIDVSSEDSDPLDTWGHNHMQLTMKHLEYLTSLGYVGSVFGYANKTSSSFPDAVACWLREYYLKERPGCEQPLPNTGVVLLPQTIAH